MELLSRSPLLHHNRVDTAVITCGAIVALFCGAHLSPPRAALGLPLLLLLALAARIYRLDGAPDHGGPDGHAHDAHDAHDLHRSPLVASTPLLAAIALYGVSWAVVMAALAAFFACIGTRPRGWPGRLPSALRDAAGGAVAAALGGLLYGVVAHGGVSAVVPTLPALYVAETALVGGAWGLAALHVVARGETLVARARGAWRAVWAALPALAGEPVLAFVLAGAMAPGSPVSVFVVLAPWAALIGGLRGHAAQRRRLERANRVLGEANARLQVQATTDTLTGLANRGLFERALAARLAEATRYGRPLAVLLIDLDGFKGVNDAYGHASGDAVLAAVAGALRRGLRGSDLPARLGGDEFAALLPETDTTRALALAQRVCAEIAAVEVEVATGATGATGATVKVRPTASVGAAATTAHLHIDAAGLLAAADGAAYVAKRAGKNRASLAA